MAEQDPMERIQNFTEVALGYSEKEALLESERCLMCNIAFCVPGCPVEIDIPGWEKLRLWHLVLDVNGTIATDGKLIEGVKERLESLSKSLQIHLVTADTHGQQQSIDEVLGTASVRVDAGREAAQKAKYVEGLGALHVASVGNGANDVEMLRRAVLGIAVMGEEGMNSEVAGSADVVCRSVCDALDLLLAPRRLVATLRR